MSLSSETKNLEASLSSVKYSLLIQGSSVNVRKYESEVDYSADVEKTFERFKQGAVKDYTMKFHSSADMNHIEAQILDFVARLYPEIFRELDNYCTRNGGYLNEVINTFDREIQFYIAYLEYLEVFKKAGLHFCYPKISNSSKEIYDYAGFDLALANKLIQENTSIIYNDFYLQGKEPPIQI